jgi:hypothetical protein
MKTKSVPFIIWAPVFVMALSALPAGAQRPGSAAKAILKTMSD